MIRLDTTGEKGSKDTRDSLGLTSCKTWMGNLLMRYMALIQLILIGNGHLEKERF